MTLEIHSDPLKGSNSGGSIVIAAIVILLTVIAYTFREGRPYSGFKLYGKEPGDIFNTKAKERFVKEGVQLLKDGFKETNGKPFQIINTNGPVIMLPPSVVEEVRNMDDLSFGQFLQHDFLSQYPGLEAWQCVKDNVFQDVIKKNLTSAIGPMTPELSQYMSKTAEELVPASKEWSKVVFPLIALGAISRLTAKVFIGEPLCSDKEWLDLSVQFTTDAFTAVQALRAWPSFLRPFVHYFLPEMRAVRAQLAKGRRMIEPQEVVRRRERREALRSGKPLPKSKDALNWFFDVAGDHTYDVTLGQMLLTFTANHTTGMTTVSLMYDLLENPEYIDPLRDEIVRAIREDGGLTKLTLNKLTLLDSCMKESQRVNMIAAVVINRQARKMTTLSDGTRIPKGAIIGVPVYPMADPAMWGPDAERFVGDRFLKLRQQPGHENRWQYVTVSAEHYGFGIGKQACPGRFMASNLMKIMMVHLLLKYDWKLNGSRPKSISNVDFIPDFNDTILCKAREPEVVL